MVCDPASFGFSIDTTTIQKMLTYKDLLNIFAMDKSNKH